MEDFKKALEGTLGRKHIDNIVDQVASFPDRFDALYTLTQHEETRIAWRATWACQKQPHKLRKDDSIPDSSDG